MPSYSAIVRQVMHDHDRHIIHSSVLLNGNRRVKCFAWRGNDEATDNLITKIKATLTEHQCPFFDVRIRKNYPDDSIIVEVPTN